MFFTAGLIQIVFAVLLVIKGVPNLYETAHSMESTFVTAREIFSDAKEVLVLVRSARDLSETLRDRMSMSYNSTDPCPGDANFTQSVTGAKITDAVNSTVEKLAELLVDLDDGIKSLDEGLLDSEKKIDALDDGAKTSTDYEMIGEPCLCFSLLLVPRLSYMV